MLPGFQVFDNVTLLDKSTNCQYECVAQATNFQQWNVARATRYHKRCIASSNTFSGKMRCHGNNWKMGPSEKGSPFLKESWNVLKKEQSGDAVYIRKALWIARIVSWISACWSVLGFFVVRQNSACSLKGIG